MEAKDADPNEMGCMDFLLLPYTLRKGNGWGVQICINPDHQNRPLDDAWTTNLVQHSEATPYGQPERIYEIGEKWINGMIMQATGADGALLRRHSRTSGRNSHNREYFSVKILMMCKTIVALQEYAYEHHCTREPGCKPLQGPITDQEMRDAQEAPADCWPGCDLVDRRSA